VTGGTDLGLYEINQAAAIIRETAHPDVNLIFGAVIDETMQDEVRITVIATGFERGVPQIRPMMGRTEHRVPAGQPIREKESVSADARSRPTKESETVRVTGINFDDYDVPAFLRNKQKKNPPRDI
jgi:cell division protein FtsZ